MTTIKTRARRDQAQHSFTCSRKTEYTAKISKYMCSEFPVTQKMDFL